MKAMNQSQQPRGYAVGDSGQSATAGLPQPENTNSGAPLSPDSSRYQPASYEVASPTGGGSVFTALSATNPWMSSPVVQKASTEDLSTLLELDNTKSNRSEFSDDFPDATVEKSEECVEEVKPASSQVETIEEADESSSQLHCDTATPQSEQNQEHLDDTTLPAQTTERCDEMHVMQQTDLSPSILNPVPDSMAQVASADFLTAPAIPSPNARDNHVGSTFSPGPPQSNDEPPDIEGGRLWEAAKQEAERMMQDRSRLAESLMERTRSCADPNALVTPNPTAGSSHSGKGLMVKINHDDDSFVLSSALAKKRVRVVQLLLIGLVGLLLGFLGNFSVNSSCHFATVEIAIGQDEQLFDFHFGLWKYSPIESVFQGYDYCYKYDSQYIDDSPTLARIANVVALLSGTCAMGILWIYLIFGLADKQRWRLGVRLAILAGFLQLGTLSFFAGSICQENSCKIGPAAVLSLLTSVVWFALACEMQYHMPVAMYASAGLNGPDDEVEHPSTLVTNFEMSQMNDVTKEYMRRLSGGDEATPRLNAGVSRTQRNRKIALMPSFSQRGSYQAPEPYDSNTF